MLFSRGVFSTASVSERNLSTGFRSLTLAVLKMLAVPMCLGLEHDALETPN
jgi:hypothetical protein